MDLTNIVFNFPINEFSSLYDGDYYKIPVITNATTILTELNTATGVAVDVAVVQYKDNLTVPRIVCSDGTDGEQPEPLLLSAISTELTDAIAASIVEVEAEITAQKQ